MVMNVAIVDIVDGKGRKQYDRAMPTRQYNDPDKMTAKEAVAYLGMKRYRFFLLVAKGIIPKHVDATYTYGYYRRADIEAFKAMMDAGEAPSLTVAPDDATDAGNA